MGGLLDQRGNMAPRGARPISSTTISRVRRIACTALVIESSARWRRTRMPRSSRLNQRHFQTSFDGDLAEGLEEECFSGSARGTDHQIFRDLRSTPTCAIAVLVGTWTERQERCFVWRPGAWYAMERTLGWWTEVRWIVAGLARRGPLPTRDLEASRTSRVRLSALLSCYLISQRAVAAAASHAGGGRACG
jgi:hypothetical protein